VVNLHNSNHGLCLTKEALQQKFNKLHNMKIPTGDPHCPDDGCLAKKVAQLMVQKSNAVDLEEVPAMDKAGDGNLLASGVYAEYDSMSVDDAKTFCNVMPVAKPEQHSNPHGRPPGLVQSNGLIEMMHLQMQQQAFLYQWDQEEKAEREKCQLEELKEEHEERCLEWQIHQQTMMMMFMAMCGGDVSNINLKNDNQSNEETSSLNIVHLLTTLLQTYSVAD
jgi:hypothetical protein